MKEKKLRQEHVIMVCGSGSCKKGGCKKLCKKLRDEIKDSRLAGEVRVQQTKCMGRCGKGPNVMVYPQGKLYTGVEIKDIAALLDTLREADEFLIAV